MSIETQLKVEGKLEALANGQKDRDELIGWMTDDIAKIPDATVRAEMQSLLPEITANLTADTALRFTDYRRRKSDATLKPEQLAALAVRGWIFGPAAGKDNALVVASGIKARRLITQYLSKTVRDDQILQELTKLESGTPDLVAKIIANMSPPKPTLDSEAVLHTSRRFRVDLQSKFQWAGTCWGVQPDTWFSCHQNTIHSDDTLASLLCPATCPIWSGKLHGGPGITRQKLSVVLARHRNEVTLWFRPIGRNPSNRVTTTPRMSMP